MPVAIISLGALGLLLGVVLGVAARKFGVEADPREEKIMSILPGANCGACGFPGCQAYCSSLLGGRATVSACPVGGEELGPKLAELMGVDFEEKESEVAVICCKGGRDKVGEKFKYSGVKDCLSAGQLQDGFKNCKYGCLGLGSCVRVCPFDAMRMGEDGLPIVIEEKCTACGLCVIECPRDIIKLIPRKQKVYLGCVSKDKGKDVKSICPVGCFTCGLCVKFSKEGAITMGSENLPEINSTDFEKLKEGIEKCPANSYALRNTVIQTVGTVDRSTGV